jgi:hypothetical protein
VEPGTTQPVPIRTFLINALASAPQPTEPGQPPRITTESKEKRFAISTKLWSKKVVDLKSVEIAFIIQSDEAYDNPLICGRVKQVLEREGQTVPEEQAEQVQVEDTKPADA